MLKSKLPPITEAAFQRQVIEAAQLLGWLVMHSRPSRAVSRYGIVRHATAIQGDVGFPDLVLTRRGVTLIVELKSEGGRLGVDQLRWLNAMAGTDSDADNWCSATEIPRYVAPHYRGSELIVVLAYPRHLRWLIGVLQDGKVP